MKFYVLAALAVLSTTSLAQAPAPPPPPVAPLILQYRYWPEQFVQWFGAGMPYSMVEFDVDQNNGKPLMELALTDRKTQKRTHYVNDESLAISHRASGDEVYVTKLALDRPEASGKDATYTIRAVLKDSVPLQWRFIQGSEMMQQGGGMTALPQIPVPVFAYRELGSVAGEGTAVSIGKQVDVAELWSEISKPPYFVAYRGAYSSGATTLIFGGGKEEWKIEASPAKMDKGATWKLSTANGRTRVLKVESLDGTHATISENDSAYPYAQHTITASFANNAWTLESIRFTPAEGEKHAATITFTNATMDVVLGKKNKIVSGSFEMSPATSAITINSPDWAKGKTMAGRVTNADGTLTITVHPKSGAEAK